eukprot:Protomagalhaensia_wolfi_Nauph_80__772@NODE_1444_length_1527_cov_21_937500_g1116_i0_p1_GENE_NODE_1444_length_1527_cov_21_937500_g1116_i0NODE_1444_length_1527_cov_21_937500_g1116_i0_p1_ORF_typecomplete_len484_score90_80PPP4R2/PF09184_11/0_00047_NODE_1444_length_1527_cov_21_937500_g1116_i0591510
MIVIPSSNSISENQVLEPESPVCRATPKIARCLHDRRRPRKAFEARPSLAELQTQLGAFVAEYATASLRPIEPPALASFHFRSLLSLWSKRSLEVVQPSAESNESTEAHLVVNADHLKDTSLPEVKHLALAKHVLTHVASSEALQFPWLHIKVLLSVQLIRRLTIRFREYVEMAYLGSSGFLDEHAPASEELLQKGRSCGLKSPADSTLGAVYHRDVQTFLEYRQLLPLLLRAYNFPPFTLPRLCELIVDQPSAANWNHNFWKWSHAVFRNLKGIASSAKQDAAAQSACPKLSKEISRAIRKTSFQQDTPSSLDGFGRLVLDGVLTDDSAAENASPLLTFKTPCQSPARPMSCGVKRPSHEWLDKGDLESAPKRRNTGDLEAVQDALPTEQECLTQLSELSPPDARIVEPSDTPLHRPAQNQAEEEDEDEEFAPGKLFSAAVTHMAKELEAETETPAAEKDHPPAPTNFTATVTAPEDDMFAL